MGPYASIPATVSLSATRSLARTKGFKQVPMKIHYPYDEPVKTIEKLTRLAEVSHWGNNLNIEDHVKLVNTGAQ